MLRQYKIVQCPHCNEYTYVPVGIRLNHCPHCKYKVPLHNFSDDIVFSAPELHPPIQINHNECQGISPNFKPKAKLSPTAYILYLLRQPRTESPQWLPLTSIIIQCLTAGLSFEEVLEAINTLGSEGFLEQRDEFLRVIPLN